MLFGLIEMFRVSHCIGMNHREVTKETVKINFRLECENIFYYALAYTQVNVL